MKKLGAAFGGGMGGMEGDCGALIGAEMLLGLLEYKGTPMHKDAKSLYDTFKEKVCATSCGEIKGINTGKMLCTCDDCVRYAVEALEAQRNN